MHRGPLAVILTLALLRTAVCADSTPSTMTHVIAQMSGVDIPADSFQAKPKVYWRAANRYCRVDEEPDPKEGIHGRVGHIFVGKVLVDSLFDIDSETK